MSSTVDDKLQFEENVEEYTSQLEMAIHYNTNTPYFDLETAWGIMESEHDKGLTMAYADRLILETLAAAAALTRAEDVRGKQASCFLCICTCFHGD